MKRGRNAQIKLTNGNVVDCTSRQRLERERERERGGGGGEKN